MHKWVVSLGLMVAVAACGREAGYEVDSGTFGNSTLNNTQMQNGERNFAQTLADRFAREVPTQINFAFDSASLDDTARQTLLKQANFIRQFPEVKFRVYGHTDAVGSASYNKRLGLRRAQAVVAFFAAQGIKRSRLEALASFGETKPLVNTPDRDRRNRRTVTEVSGFVGRHPTVLDGKYAQIIYRDYVKSAEAPTKVTSTSSSGGFSE
ncbi:OmpA family protein [Falsiruegeria mediterranea]|jgi:peptidoglycan-associated lipoprotein|uniref:Outer membrane lipoprotein Omp16 n=1 Tax=Falsiruegeria mediterranea M17 TaxID=1200281 RepID=A0A2R8CD24_9RHOB|nr:OmpA family protein [Falsiruegeria mediterranea]SPJ30299.1 Outer membrane lipoprotein Omp16 [Falsiruegeria mediterranea M17]